MWSLNHQSVTPSPSDLARAEEALKVLFQRKDVGFFQRDILEKGMVETEALCRSLTFKPSTFCVLGMGGSSLGAQALVEALAPEAMDRTIHFFDNVDSRSFFRRLAGLVDMANTQWIIISKSGTTIETLSQCEYIDQYLQKNHQLRLADRSVVVTEKRDNALYNWAQQNKVPTLEVPQSVGGRFSVLTPVGLYALHQVGVPIQHLFKGAEAALVDVAFVRNLIAQFTLSFARQETTTYFFSYCDDLCYWGQWLQQLWAESLGKAETNSKAIAPALSVPYACRGATDQHSVLQQIAQGTQRKLVCFLRVEESENSGELLSRSLFADSSPLLNKGLGELLSAEAAATQQALNESKIESLTLRARALTAESMGYLMMAFELTVAALGLAHNINPFDQPGVERGKVITRSILSRKS